MLSSVALLWAYLLNRTALGHHHHTRVASWDSLQMWTIMMAAMMLPAILPALLYIAQRSPASLRRSVIAAMGFSCGYLALWSGFAALAAFVPFEQTDAFGTAALLILAGAHQVSASKSACLSKCCTLAACKHAAALEGFGAAFLSGLRHGRWCLGCCWTLMLLMFIDGAMSLTAMAILTVYLLWERFVAPRRALLHGVGLALIIYGIALAL